MKMSVGLLRKGQEVKDATDDERSKENRGDRGCDGSEGVGRGRKPCFGSVCPNDLPDVEAVERKGIKRIGSWFPGQRESPADSGKDPATDCDLG
jgi:hypothetical protein